MGYYLLDHPNPHGQHFYDTRRNTLRVIVLHITAGLEDQDLIGTDNSAEATAKYAATIDREVSWHAGADSDSYLYLLPDGYTAWHASDYNSISWGIEISKRDATWSGAPAEWVRRTLRNAANAARPIATKYDIPARLLTKAQVDAGHSGFVYHASLDPARRSDPGKDFPIDQFFALLTGTGATQPRSWFDMADAATLAKVIDERLAAFFKGAPRNAKGGPVTYHNGNTMTRDTALAGGARYAFMGVSMLGALKPLFEAAAAGTSLTPAQVDEIAKAAAAALPEGIAEDVANELGERITAGKEA